MASSFGRSSSSISRRSTATRPESCSRRKPRLTLSDAKNTEEDYKLVVKPGCDAAIAGFGLNTWRLDRDQLVLTGRTSAWRFTESDPTTWERVR